MSKNEYIHVGNYCGCGKVKSSCEQTTKAIAETLENDPTEDEVTKLLEENELNKNIKTKIVDTSEPAD